MSCEKSLLYFCRWNFIWFLQKEPTKVQNFRLLTAQVKFHQICTFIGSFWWKYIKCQLKRTGVISWYWRVVQNLKKKRFFWIWWILIWALKRLKKLHFDWSLLCKVYNVWSKKVQRHYISWHWRVMQNLKKNWLGVWKITWGNWEIFIETLESVKIGTFIWSFCTK